MSIYQCTQCDQQFTKPTLLANHIRWNHKIEENISTKFQVKCSCIQCKQELTTANLENHIFHQHAHTYPKQPKSFCLHCKNAIYNLNKFCSSSCSAIYSNNKKDFTKIKSGPPKGFIPKNAPAPYTKIAQCVICGKYHPKNGKTCSKECKSTLLSKKANERIDNGWNPQENRCRSKPSYLERSFEIWLNQINISDYVKNKTFRCGEKIYYGDFFFPKQNLLIELDGKQHKDNIEYDMRRDKLIKQYHGVETIRISYDEFVKKSKVQIVLSHIQNTLSSVSDSNRC